MAIHEVKGEPIQRVGNEECQADNRNVGDECLIQVRKFDPEYKGARRLSSDVSIFRVPITLKSLNEEAYLPKVVALGPYHHKSDPHLYAMNEYKVEAVQRMLPRLNNMPLNTLVARVQEWESEIRNCYEEDIEWSGETFAWKFTMDACFIIEFLMALHSTSIPQGFVSDTSVFRRRAHANVITFGIVRDLFKLENQLPLFILKRMLDLVPQFPLSEVLRAFFLFSSIPFLPDSLMESDKFLDILKKLIEKARHLLELQILVMKNLTQSADSTSKSPTSARCDRWKNLVPTGVCCFPPRMFSSPPSKQIIISPPSAEQLRKAGIRFGPSSDGKLWFEKKMLGPSTLFLPHIIIHDSSKIFLLNMMAYEECQIDSDGYVKRLVFFFNSLIDSERDVALLREEGVIKNLAGSDEIVADLFNDVLNCFTTTPISEIEMVGKEVFEHYNRPVNRLITEFNQQYCSRPWYVVSLVAAIVILVLTAVQTFYAIQK